jgi:uncharacterized protein YkwD
MVAGAAGPTVVASSASSSPSATIARRHGGRAKGARASCARAARRARAASRGCGARTRLRGDSKLRRTHSRRDSEPAPTSEEATTATEPEAPVQNAAAVIATVLATPCQNTELTPESQNIELVRGAILCLINRKRAENGESPLAISPQLQQAAEGHCEELIADDYFAHVSPSGETPVDRIRDTGYIPNTSDGYVIGENLAWGTYQLSTPDAIVAAWFASPGHLANILETQYTETGVGVVAAVPASLGEGAPGATYAQEFGVIVR